MAVDETELSFIRCPNCRSLVPAVASRCRMCGFILKGEGSETAADDKPSRVRQRTISASNEEVEHFKEEYKIDAPVETSVDAIDEYPIYAEPDLDSDAELEGEADDFGGEDEEIEDEAQSVDSPIPGPKRKRKRRRKKRGVDAQQPGQQQAGGDQFPAQSGYEGDAVEESEEFFDESELVTPPVEETPAENITPWRSAESKERAGFRLGGGINGQSEKQERPFKEAARFDPVVSERREDKRVERREERVEEIRVEPTRGEQTRSEQPRFEQKPEQSRAEQPRPDQSRQEHQRPDTQRTEQPRFDSSRGDQSRHDSSRGQQQSRSDQGRNDQSRHDQGRNDQGRNDRNQSRAVRAPSQEGDLIGWLVSYQEDSKGVARELRSGKFFVGGDQLRPTDFVISHPTVSTPQCLVVCDGARGVTIQDLMSERGTFVRRAGAREYERHSEQVQLSNGDRVKFGEYELLFVEIPN